MRCNGVPDTKNPGDLRKYLHILSIDMKEQNDNERNWLLKTDERTLLTQDPNMQNLSKEYLRKQQENLGDIYSKSIKGILKILTELDETLEDETAAQSIINDLLKLKLEFRLNLTESINDFTYKILSHIERDMESDTPGIAKHIYESDVFKSQIFTFLGETQVNQKDKMKDALRHTEIDFKLLELQLSLPPSIKVQNSALRGLWLNYDHFSDYCYSYRLPKIKQKYLNILQQTKKEWKKRKEILQATLDDTTKEITTTMLPLLPPTTTVPDSNLDQQQQQLQSQQQQKSRTIDIDKIYTEYEDEINKLRRNEMQLNLSENDINLRRYRIIGGVYSIDYIEQPQQDKKLNAYSFIRTIFYPTKLKHKKFYHIYRPPPPVPPGVRRLPEEIEAEIKMIEQNLDKLAMITVQLPDTVLWFEPPIVCRWETPDETIESNIKEAELNKNKPINQSTETNKLDDNENSLIGEESISTIPSVKKVTNPNELKRNSSVNLYNLPIKEIEDFDLKNIPNHIDLFNLITEFVIPRMPYGWCIRINHFNNETNETSIQYLSIKPIKENLIKTNSPRPLFQQLNFKKILKIKETPDSSRQKQIIKTTNTQQITPYMFSQLIKDLDELYESQIPFLDDQVHEISSKLEDSSNVDEDDDADNITENNEFKIKSSKPPTPRRFSGVIMIRETDIPENHLKIHLGDDLTDSEQESCSEYDDDENDDDNANVENLFRESEDNASVCCESGKWSTHDIHDAKFNEDKLCMQFRTGRLGYFGFAANRYSNMPYQTWEIKPDMKNPGVIVFSLTAAVISLEMTITIDGFCITNFQGGSVEPLNHIIDHTMSMKQLKYELAKCSIDIFPDDDAFCYTEGSCEKNYVMEMHLYRCMSTLSLSHNFSWSRWNLLSGSRIAVLLMRELIEGRKVPNHSSLYVTPLKASVVDCTEVSASFSTVGIPGMEYYADLHHLAEAHAHPINKEKRNNINPILMNNVADILMSVRPLSFC